MLEKESFMLALGFVAGSGCLEITKAKQILEDGEEEQPKKEKERKKERKKETHCAAMAALVCFLFSSS